MPMPTHLLPTTVVGSYPQPDWLIDREMLSKMVPRTRVKVLWRVAPEFLEQAAVEVLKEEWQRRSWSKLPQGGGLEVEGTRLG